jgi:hypothetical protein
MPPNALRTPRLATLLVGTAAIAAVGFLLIGVVERGWLSGAREGRGAKGDMPSEAGAALGRAGPSAAPSGVVCIVCGTVKSIGQFPTKGDEPVPSLVRVTVRMDDGSFRSFAEAPERQFRIGDRVRIVEGAVVAEAM